MIENSSDDTYRRQRTNKNINYRLAMLRLTLSAPMTPREIITILMIFFNGVEMVKINKPAIGVERVKINK